MRLLTVAKTCSCIIFLLLGIILPALGEKSDSLLEAIDNEHNSVKKAALFLDLGKELMSTDLKKAKTYTHRALLLASESKEPGLKGLSYAQIGDIAFLQDSLALAEQNYNKAIPFLREAGTSHRLIRVMMGMGNRFIEQGNYPAAMNYYMQGLTIAQDTRDSTYLPNLYNNLGVVYINMNDHRTALEYYSKALPLFEKNRDTLNIAGATTNIGSIYIHLNEYDIATRYYNKGLEIFRQINHMAGQAHALFKLAWLDQKQGNYSDALEKLFKSKRLQLQPETKTPGSKSMFLAETDINIGINYFNLGQTNKAREYLKTGLAAAQGGGQISLIADASKYLSKIYKQEGDFEKALEYYIRFKTYSDSTFNEENVRKLTQIEMQHHFNEQMKDEEMKRLDEMQKQRRLIFIYVGTTVILLLLLVIFGLMLKLEKNKKKEIELERKRLQDKLDHTNKELTTYVMYLLKKNEFILTIVDKLKRARLDAKPENKKIMAELINELQSNTETVSWEEFEVRFQQVHTDFYTKLNKRFPDLTTNEIRLCAFFKLNMTTKEIAAITYQSLNSIKVARYRLRKKLKLEKDESLVSFLGQF